MLVHEIARKMLTKSLYIQKTTLHDVLVDIHTKVMDENIDEDSSIETR